MSNQNNIVRLSNSAIELYKTCPYRYKLHYVDRIRGTTTSSPLFFGKAIDEALNCMLLTKKKSLTEEEEILASANPFEVFDKEFKTTSINNESVDIALSEKAEYYNTDCDLELLTEEDYSNIENVSLDNLIDISRENIVAFYEECIFNRKNKIPLEVEVQKMFNFIAWLSLRRKGHMMLEAYKHQIMPKIQEVHTIQRKVMLPDADGNYIVGYIDFEATWEDGVRRVLDNKTCSYTYYRNLIVETSQQLALYSEYAENRECGYICILKKLKKRNPRVSINLKFATIPETTVEEVFDTVGNVLLNIKNEEFPKNENNCFMYGKPCPYFSYCKSNGVNHENLLKLPKKDLTIEKK